MRVDWGETLKTNVPVQCYWESVVIFATRGRSRTTLTRFFPISTTYATYTPCWHLGQNYFTVLGENLHTVGTSYTTHLPSLVNAVCERPQTKKIQSSLLQLIRLSCCQIFDNELQFCSCLRTLSYFVSLLLAQVELYFFAHLSYSLQRTFFVKTNWISWNELFTA